MRFQKLNLNYSIWEFKKHFFLSKLKPIPDDAQPSIHMVLTMIEDIKLSFRRDMVDLIFLKEYIF